MTKPRIGISGNHIIDDHGAFAGYHRSYVNDDYVQSVIRAGGIPFIIPFNDDKEITDSQLDAVDGLILSGGHDVCPLFFGEEPLQGIGDVWPERDQFDFTLLDAAAKRGLPIMAICRGHQIVNVHRKGTLYQDLKYDANCTIKHSQNQRPELPTHTVEIEPDSDLAKVLGVTSWVTNSHHHQTIKDVGQNLRVVGRAKDGTVEAMEATDYPYLKTYQFHPEMMSATNENAHKLFEDFIHACIEKRK